MIGSFLFAFVWWAGLCSLVATLALVGIAVAVELHDWLAERRRRQRRRRFLHEYDELLRRSA